MESRLSLLAVPLVGRLAGRGSPGARTALAAGIALCLAAPQAARGQLATEVIDLEFGWNAVWFNVAPEPGDLIGFLGQQPPPLDCQAIWTFDPNRDVRTSASMPGRWYFYDKDVPPQLHTLKTLQGHRAYYILVNVAGQLELGGRPVIRETSFTAGASNQFGALTDTAGGPLTFEEFFAHPTARGKVRSAGQPVKHDIFALQGQTLLRRSISDPIAPNRAYWVNVVQNFDYAGPLDVQFSANGLSFGRNTSRRTMSIEIPSSPTSRAYTFMARPCAGLSGGSCGAATAGEEWLEYRDPNSGSPPVWRPLADGLVMPVPAETTRIDLDVRAQRTAAVAVARSQRGTTVALPLVIDVTDDQGARVVIPADVTVEPVYGLWIGRAELTLVSTHASVQDLPLNQAEAVPIGMTLLLDLPSPSAVAAGAGPRLLDGVTIPTFRDGRSLNRRFTSVLFDRPVDLVEDGSDPIDPFGTTGTLAGTVRILPEDPLNPYRHRYHPEHRKGFDITRQITVQLEVSAPSLADQLAGLDGTFGPQRLSGVYTEVITGLTHDAITVQGRFQLERLIGDPVASLD